MKDEAMAGYKRLIRSTKWLFVLPVWLCLDVASSVLAQSIDSKADIRIGMVNAQTGPVAELGQAMLTGAQAVFNEINAKGGVHGRKIVLQVADDAYEPEQTLEKTQQMVQDEQVLALFGYTGTPTVNAVLPLIDEHDVPLIGVISGSYGLRQPILRRVFNLRASYQDETEAIVARLLEKGAKKVAVVYQNDGFGLAVLSGVDSALLKRGAVVHAAGSFQRNTVAIRMALSTMVEQQPDAIVLAGHYTPVAAFIKQVRATGLRPQFATVSVVGTERLMEQLGVDGQGMLISQVVPLPNESELPIARDCRAALQRQSGKQMTFITFEACISARLLVRALEKAGPKPTRKALVASLESMRSADLGGLPIQLSEDNHQASDLVFLTEILDGKLVSAR